MRVLVSTDMYVTKTHNLKAADAFNATFLYKHLLPLLQNGMKIFLCIYALLKFENVCSIVDLT